MCSQLYIVQFEHLWEPQVEILDFEFQSFIPNSPQRIFFKSRWIPLPQLPGRDSTRCSFNAPRTNGRTTRRPKFGPILVSFSRVIYI